MSNMSYSAVAHPGVQAELPPIYHSNKNLSRLKESLEAIDSA